MVAVVVSPLEVVVVVVVLVVVIVVGFDSHFFMTAVALPMAGRDTHLQTRHRSLEKEYL